MTSEEPVQVSMVVRARIPTLEGEFELCVYENDRDDKEHLAYITGDVDGKENVLVRVHSECFTGDTLGSLRCDCGEQLARSMHMIAQAGEGVLIYMRQEGRGIGLREKLRAYNLQDEGYDTVDANLILGHQADGRDYTVAAAILNSMGVRSIRLLTNNPNKIEDLQAHGIEVTERVALTPTVNPENEKYLYTKLRRMNHLLNLPTPTLDGREEDNGSG